MRDHSPMKSLSSRKLVASLLVASFVISGVAGLSTPKIVAAADTTGCAGGFAVATGIFAWATTKATVAAQTGSEAPPQNYIANKEQASKAINDCILRPLAQAMVVALIRNIGTSIVNWVNTGFNGQPGFVTNLDKTLQDSADEAIGQFIEHDPALGFLCSPFSFQVRLELALKYSKPFEKNITCTLTEIGDNINNFANNNGGAGWDRWLQITTEPQNNVYGAYLIADSELAQRAARAVGIKEKKITLGQGFLDFETCDAYESDGQTLERLAADQNQKADIFGSESSKTTAQTIKVSAADIAAKKKCLPGKTSTKTPGKIVAAQLENEFTKGAIQTAVAQEIDQVISATLTQLAQKVMTGAGGLLGLSQKKSSSSASYIDRYRAQLYGQTTTATIDDLGGAQSELDGYTVQSYDEALALRNDPNNQALQNILGFTDRVGGEQIAAQQGEVTNAVGTYLGTSTARNVALGKSAIESSVLNTASYGNDGVKQISQYLKGAETSSDQPGGWWEVDLGEDRAIKIIRVYENNSPSAQNGALGNFTVTATAGNGVVTTYSSANLSSQQGSGVFSIAVGKATRYIRLTRIATEQMCEQKFGRGSNPAIRCQFQPHLAFAELEAIEDLGMPSLNATSTGSQSNSGSLNDNTPAIDTLSWNPAIASGATVRNGSSFDQTITLSTVKSVSGLGVEISLYDPNGKNIPFTNVFQNFDILRGAASGTWVSTQSVITATTGTVRVNLSINQNSGYSFRIMGSKQTQTLVGVAPGSYSIITRVYDSTGQALTSKTQRINFVVQ